MHITSLNTIPLDEVLHTMDSGQEFCIGVRTFNKQRDTGGEYILLDRAVKGRIQPGDKNGIALASGEKFRKDPRHWENSTRNIVNLLNGETMKIHLRLIMDFNGKRVL